MNEDIGISIFVVFGIHGRKQMCSSWLHCSWLVCFQNKALTALCNSHTQLTWSAKANLINFRTLARDQPFWKEHINTYPSAIQWQLLFICQYGHRLSVLVQRITWAGWVRSNVSSHLWSWVDTLHCQGQHQTATPLQPWSREEVLL